MADNPYLSKTPITDGINRQFDAWDAQIEEAKRKSAEAAKEQCDKIKEDIKNYTEEKKEELTEQRDETNDKSQPAKAIDAIKDGIKDIDEAVGAINKMIKFLADSAMYLIAVAADTMQAPTTLVTRANQSLQKLGEPPDSIAPVPDYVPPDPEPTPETGS